MTQIVRLATAFALSATLLVPASARATDFLIPGKIHIIKDTKLTKLVAKPTSGTFTIPGIGSAGDPTINGGNLTVIDIADGLGLTTALPTQLAPLGWKGLGVPAGLKGWKYKGTGVGADPCKIVLVKPAVIKFVCKDDQLLNPPLTGNSGINLALGADNYCAEFGGTEVKNITGLFKFKDAPAPSACSGVSTTTSTSSSTTSSTIGGPCCGGLSHGVFTSGPAEDPMVEDCGTIYNADGSVFAPVVCGGLYFGGGGNAVPLPTITPDLGQTVVELTSCTGQIASVGPTTSTDTGSPLNCSSPGCFFGAPLSIPNAATTPTSTCLLVTVTTSVSGTVNCSAGTQDISLPTQSAIHLTGDGETDPGDSIPGIQPCPLCIDTGGGDVCVGGPNNGMSCTPGDTDQSGTALGYPTSHDCPPEPSLLIGTIPNNLAPTTGTVSWTGTVATNDTGSTASSQTRVFAGYCHDNALPGGTSSFDADPAPGNQFKQCWENGMAIGTPCSEADNGAESCEQREHGAYGPGGGAVRTITVTGTPAGPVVDGAPHAQKLVTNFSVPPTFDATVDASANLPGPGSLALTGTTELCSSANPCPDGP